jgi:hypothetical protein
MKKILLAISLIWVTACVSNPPVPVVEPKQEKLYTLEEIDKILHPATMSKFEKVAEPCFYMFTIGWKEFDKRIMFPIPPEYTCKGNTL